MDKYGLIGFPLKHSFSKDFFNEKFRAENIDARYENFEIPAIKDFPAIIEENPTLRGLNVTIPYKEEIIPFLDDIDKAAKAIGAVNVIKITRPKGKTKLTGFNSDIIGFTRSIEPLLEPHHTHALVLGTGGAAKAICHGLQQLGITPMYVTRQAKNGMLTYGDLTPEIMERHKVIVNCTPVGMFPDTGRCPSIPYDCLTSSHLLYDLIYNPERTTFLKEGAAHKAIVKNGLGMLLLQAIASWEIWNK